MIVLPIVNNDLWIEKIQNPVTRERTKRRLLCAYEIQGDIFYGSREVYDRLQELGYTDITYYMVNHMVNNVCLSKWIRKKYPELDPNDPNGLVQLKSKGQFYDRHKKRKTGSKFVLIYYFENDQHSRFYGISNKRPDLVYKNFIEVLKYFEDEDQDIEHYTFHSHDIVRTNGKIRIAYDEIDKAIFEYVSDNPDYLAYNIDSIRYI